MDAGRSRNGKQARLMKGESIQINRHPCPRDHAEMRVWDGNNPYRNEAFGDRFLEVTDKGRSKDPKSAGLCKLQRRSEGRAPIDALSL